MTLSPFEVERREFGRTAMGYKPRDVDRFLEEVHRSLSQLWQERGDAREENERLKERLQRFEQIEDQLKNTLLLAQDSAEKAHEQARRESDLMLREAGQKARDIVHAAHEDKQRREMVLRDLHSAEQEARQRLRSLTGAIISHLDNTEQLVADGATTFRAIVQAHPESTPPRATGEGEEQSREARLAAQIAETAARDATRLARDAGIPQQSSPEEGAESATRPGGVRELARSEAADAFFEAPPTFDPDEVVPRSKRRQPVPATGDDELDAD